MGDPPGSRSADGDPGVPEALPRALRALAEAVGPEALDRVWVFPPLRNGRSETGLLAAGCFAGSERRLLVTFSYRSEETGRGVRFDGSFQEEGEAPAERLPRIMEGVVSRMKNAPGDPEPRALGGDRERLAALLREWGDDAPLPDEAEAASHVEPQE